MAAPAQVTDADFEQTVLKSALPVLVDFYGTWCAPCIQLKPVIAEIADELDSKLTVVEAEISQAPDSASNHDVLGVPTLMLFIGGESRDSLVRRVNPSTLFRYSSCLSTISRSTS